MMRPSTGRGYRLHSHHGWRVAPTSGTRHPTAFTALGGITYASASDATDLCTIQGVPDDELLQQMAAATELDCVAALEGADVTDLLEVTVDARDQLSFTNDPGTAENLIVVQIQTETFDSWAFGGAFTADEVAEISARLDLQSQRSGVDSLAAQQPTYAGSYIDHQRGGVLVVQFTDDPNQYRSSLSSALTDPSRLLLEQVDFSLADLEELEERIYGDDFPGWSESVTVTSTSISNELNSLVVAIAETPADPMAFLPGDGSITVETGAAPLVPVGCTQGACGTYIGGLEIVVGNNACTSGYVASASDGTARVVTAGHCAGNSGEVGMAVSHNGRAVGTIDRNDNRITAPGHGRVVDAARTTVASGVPVDALIMRSQLGGGLANVVAVNRNVQQDGNWVCLSGRNNDAFEAWFGIRCGQALRKVRINHQWRDWIVGESDHTWSEVMEARVRVAGGDSGGPVYEPTSNRSNVKAAGITTIKQGDHVYYTPARYVEESMGVTIRTK